MTAFVRNAVLAIAATLLAANFGLAQATDEDHKPSIRGIEIGMTAQQVLDHLGRMPDGRKDEKDEAIIIWKVENDNVLQVRFRKERVSHIGLQYKRPRPTTELWLQPLYSAPGGVLTARDPRLRIDYRATETGDKLRSVWTRQEKAAAGYRVEIQFLSASRKTLGDRFEDFIEFKYVTVAKDDLSKFEKAIPAKQ